MCRATYLIQLAFNLIRTAAVKLGYSGMVASTEEQRHFYGPIYLSVLCLTVTSTKYAECRVTYRLYGTLQTKL